MRLTDTIYVSTGLTGKMQGMPAISTNILTNPFCQKMAASNNKKIICTKCYGIPALKRYKHAREHYERNGKILSKKVLKKEDAPKTDYQYVRLHSHGELINLRHLKNFCTIAKANPRTKFALWTKRADLVNKVDIPKNMILVYSEPLEDVLNPKIPAKFHRVFSVYSKEFVKEHDIDINCGSSVCKECMKCYSKRGNKFIRELSK